MFVSLIDYRRCSLSDISPVASYYVDNLANTVKNNGYQDSVMHQLDRYNLIVEQEPWYKMTKCDYLVYAGRYDEAISLLERSKQITSRYEALLCIRGSV